MGRRSAERGAPAPGLGARELAAQALVLAVLVLAVLAAGCAPRASRPWTWPWPYADACWRETAKGRVPLGCWGGPRGRSPQVLDHGRVQRLSRALPGERAVAWAPGASERAEPRRCRSWLGRWERPSACSGRKPLGLDLALQQPAGRRAHCLAQRVLRAVARLRPALGWAWLCAWAEAEHPCRPSKGRRGRKRVLAAGWRAWMISSCPQPLSISLPLPEAAR